MASSGSEDRNAGNFRLPKDVLPTHYDLAIKTDLKKELFQGFVNVRLEVVNETSSLVFNAAGLEVSGASLHSHDLKTSQLSTSKTFDPEAERCTLDFPATLPANTTATLSLSFSGKLTGDVGGYFKSTYEHAGEQGVYSLTHFAPTAARRAFPCWDEPSYKATFTIVMISRADTINLSNMPVASEEVYKGGLDNHDDAALEKIFATLTMDEWKITKFHISPPMSTYFTAYANGPFVHVETTYQSPLTGKIRPLRIYATPDIIGQAQCLLDTKARVLPIYEQLFNIEYSLPKLDTLVAHNLDPGAMENWGLIIGHTSVFLLDPARDDLTTRQRVTWVESHEVAHMWFGNIATMEWWEYLYLNEGFATFMGEVVSLDKLHPEWKVDSRFITSHLNKALELDAKLSSHPIEVPCPDAKLIGQIFDALSYSKAASVLRMLYNFIGQERFLEGVSIYLKDHLYGSTITRDLWDAMNKAVNASGGASIDVPAMMENWIMKVGFPVLTVAETPDGLKVRQNRFLESGPAEDKDDETIWTIPLALLTADSAGNPYIDNTAVLNTRETVFAVDTSNTYKFNTGTYGSYRVLYPAERLSRIAQEAAEGDTIFSLNDRIGLVHDTMALAKSGHGTISSALTVVDMFRNESEFLVWDSIAENLSNLVGIWYEHEDIYRGLEEFRRGLFRPIVDRLGYEYSPSESYNISELRTRAIGQTAAAGDRAVVNTLKEMFATYMATKDESVIPANLFRIAAATAVQYGGVDEYKFVKGLYEDVTTSSTAAITAIFAMCATQDKACQEDLEEFILTKAKGHDVVYFIAYRGTNYARGRGLAKFFLRHFQTMEDRFQNNFAFQHMIRIAFTSLSTDEDIQEVGKFFEGRDTSRYHLALAQGLDAARSSVAWIRRSRTDILEWLEKRRVRL